MRELVEELRRSGRLTLSVKVIPRSPRNEVIGRMADGAWKVRIAAPPERGRANAELCAFIAGLFGVPAANVTIAAGAGSSRKVLRVVQ
jgi:uncharacterized protein (TIGR00251 family)